MLANAWSDRRNHARNVQWQTVVGAFVGVQA